MIRKSHSSLFKVTVAVALQASAGTALSIPSSVWLFWIAVHCATRKQTPAGFRNLQILISLMKMLIFFSLKALVPVERLDTYHIDQADDSERKTVCISPPSQGKRLKTENKQFHI